MQNSIIGVNVIKKQLSKMRSRQVGCIVAKDAIKFFERRCQGTFFKIFKVLGINFHINISQFTSANEMSEFVLKMPLDSPVKITKENGCDYIEIRRDLTQLKEKLKEVL